MQSEQLSFFEPIEKEKHEKHITYSATICNRCCCNKCKYNVELNVALSDKECQEIGDRSCFNCDECYYYGMDDENLSKNIIKFECNKFEIAVKSTVIQ